MNTVQTSTVPAIVETPEQELTRLRAENEALKAVKAQGIKGMKVSEKGALSIYGLGRFPVTLYRSQWEKLIEGCTGGFADQLRAFITLNAAKLSVKE